MTYEQMKRILLYCRILGLEGLKNGNSAKIPELEIDLSQKNSLIGVSGNPAIFVSAATYKKLKQFHSDWIPNVTIAISNAYLLEPRRSTVDIIGVLIHETGHAFNVYAKILNSEANAYLFEIETMIKLFKMRVLTRQFNLTKEDLRIYFQSRLEQYSLETAKNPDLKKLVDFIIESYGLKNKDIELEPRVNVQTKLGFFKEEKQAKQDHKHEINPEPGQVGLVLA